MAAKTEKTVTTSMDLPTARVHKGTAYGPGVAVEIPAEVAEVFKAADATAAPVKHKRGKSE